MVKFYRILCLFTSVPYVYCHKLNENLLHNLWQIHNESISDILPIHLLELFNIHQFYGKQMQIFGNTILMSNTLCYFSQQGA